MTFQECCAVCLDNQEFLTQFNRLTGNAIGTQSEHQERELRSQSTRHVEGTRTEMG